MMESTVLWTEIREKLAKCHRDVFHLVLKIEREWDPCNDNCKNDEAILELTKEAEKQKKDLR